jgi:hypothetical protein
MWVWATPDATTQPYEQLEPGTPVQVVVATTTGWSRVRCDNGFTGWVDHAQLILLSHSLPDGLSAAEPPPVPAGPPPIPAGPPPLAARAPPRRRALLVASLVVTAVAALIAVVAVRSSGDDDGDASVGPLGGTAGAVQETAVRLHLPAGWVRSDDGLRAAEADADLAAAVPVGPVVRAIVLDERAGEPGGELDFAGDIGGDGVSVEEPESTLVDGFAAVSVVVRGPDRHSILVAVHPPGAAAVAFRMDAPAGRFDALREVLESIPGVAV